MNSKLYMVISIVLKAKNILLLLEKLWENSGSYFWVHSFLRNEENVVPITIWKAVGMTVGKEFKSSDYLNILSYKRKKIIKKKSNWVISLENNVYKFIRIFTFFLMEIIINYFRLFWLFVCIWAFC